MNLDPLGVVKRDDHLIPPEDRNWPDDSRITYLISKAMPETLTIHFEIPPEPDFRSDFIGMCGCDRCREAAQSGVRHTDDCPMEIWRGTTYFKLDGKLIHCDCLGGYLTARQMVGR